MLEKIIISALVLYDSYDKFTFKASFHMPTRQVCGWICPSYAWILPLLVGMSIVKHLHQIWEIEGWESCYYCWIFWAIFLKTWKAMFFFFFFVIPLYPFVVSLGFSLQESLLFIFYVCSPIFFYLNIYLLFICLESLIKHAKLNWKN
jgi:hypothetical protein